MQLLKFQFFLSDANEKRECNFSHLFLQCKQMKINKIDNADVDLQDLRRCPPKITTN